MNFLSIPKKPYSSLPGSRLNVPPSTTLARNEVRTSPGSAANPQQHEKNKSYSLFFFLFSGGGGGGHRRKGGFFAVYLFPIPFPVPPPPIQDTPPRGVGRESGGGGQGGGCGWGGRRSSPAGRCGARGRRGPGSGAGGKRAPSAASPGMLRSPGEPRAGQISLSGDRRPSRYWPVLSHGLQLCSLDSK